MTTDLGERLGFGDANLTYLQMSNLSFESMLRDNIRSFVLVLVQQLSIESRLERKTHTVRSAEDSVTSVSQINPNFILTFYGKRKNSHDFFLQVRGSKFMVIEV